MLVGAIDHDESTAFTIGVECVHEAKRTGELTCYANDDPAFHWNNWGSIALTVTQVT